MPAISLLKIIGIKLPSVASLLERSSEHSPLFHHHTVLETYEFAVAIDDKAHEDYIWEGKKIEYTCIDTGSNITTSLSA